MSQCMCPLTYWVLEQLIFISALVFWIWMCQSHQPSNIKDVDVKMAGEDFQKLKLFKPKLDRGQLDCVFDSVANSRCQTHMPKPVRMYSVPCIQDTFQAISTNLRYQEILLNALISLSTMTATVFSLGPEL